MPALLTALDLAWDLLERARQFTRKRAPGQEDHWFPAEPGVLGLDPGQCFHCHDHFRGPPYPRRGCPGLPVRP